MREELCRQVGVTNEPSPFLSLSHSPSPSLPLPVFRVC